VAVDDPSQSVLQRAAHALARGAYAALPKPMGHHGEQEGQLEMRDFERAFHALPAVQREALSLVGASGFSYGEAAKIVGCAQGTVKSRVCRARMELDRSLGRENSAEPDSRDLKIAA
jgi:RNA polymerase sigma-70 factor (ECF subfamily)